MNERKKGDQVEKAYKRLRVLRMAIERHDRLYYQENRPEISDFEYDCLQAEKKALLQLHPELEWREGPGNDLTRSHFPTCSHLSPMLSLNNTYSKEELFEFGQRLLKVQERCIYLLEPKVDGVAINLIYKDGVLENAVTRGDGEKGEVVTENVKTIAEIPLFLRDAPTLIEVRGEIYLTQEQFQQLNQEQESLGLETYANARNLAAGSLKLLDTTEVKKRHLYFIAHGIGFIHEEVTIETQAHVHTLLHDWGFPVFPSLILKDNLEQVWDFIVQFQATEKNLHYGTDGVVIKVNDRVAQVQLGATAKAPRWAIAYKFEPESAETYLQEVLLQVGRTGVITPVAELTPIDLGGSRVSRATLHNFEEIQRKDIRKGDYVVLQKAGEVIPAIVGVNKNKRSSWVEKIAVPIHCPACGAPLSKIHDEVAIRCTSLSCPPQLRLKIVHFASKDALDIEGMGPKVVHVLVHEGWLKDVSDVFQLWRKRDLWLQLPGFSYTSVDNLLMAIEQAKRKPLWRLLYGLSLPNVGIESAKQLSFHCLSLENVMCVTLQTLASIPLIGKITAQGIVDFWSNEHNRSIAHQLIKLGLMTKTEETLGPWHQKSFVLTGKLTHMTRSQAEQAIISLGGSVGNVVTKQTFALVVGEDPGNKLTKATTNNTTIWTEAEFLQHVEHDRAH